MRKVLSLWKVILIILASFVGVGGATTLGLYLTGSFNKVVVNPEDMKFSRVIDGEGFYNEDKSAYELSADSKLTINCTTEGVTEKEITLSLRNGTERNGYITDGVITIPKIVEFNKPFEVQLVKTYNENIYQNWIKGGTSYITAKSSNVNLTAQYATISVDVPVYEIDLKVSGTEKTAEEKETNTQTVVVDSVFTLDTAFTPVESRYFYNDTERERGIYFSVTGRNAISYDETTKRFTALKVSDSGEESIVTAYVFANAFFERKYFEAHPEATSDEIVAYLSSRVGTEAVSTKLNILVESVDVQQFDFTLNGGSVLAYVDKEYMITLNSNNGDKSLGVVVKDADGNVLTDLYGQVGIRIPQGVSNMTILGGRIVVEDADGIRYEDYNSAKNYFNAPEGTTYYILPNTAPSNANNYFWTFTSTDDVDATEMFVNFFFEKDGERTKFFATDEEKSFVLTIAKHADLAVGWVEPEKSISLKINYNEQGEPISASEDLSRLIKQVDTSNVYKTIKYFLFAEENDVDLTEVFVCEAGKTYTVDYNGERFVVDNEPTTRESYTLFELRGSTLTAKRSFNGTAKVIAAIIRTNENGEPYYDADRKYLVVAAGRSKEIVVESSLSIANMEATYSFAEGITPADDGKYYIPSERKTTEGSDEVMLTLQFTLRSDDIENDVNKIPAAFANNKLRVVCLDENGNESEKQYLSLANLVEDEEQRTAISAVFNGRFYVNPGTVTAFDVDGIPVKLQLQYEEFSKEILRAETEDEDTFYIYYQKPTTLKGKYEDDADSYPVYEDEGAHISVSIKTPEEGQEAGIEIYWQEQSIEEGEPVWVNGTQIDGLSALQALFEYTMADSKGKEVRPQDGLYRFYFAELDDEGNIKTTNNVLSFNGDSTALVSINSTNGNAVTTKMRVFVKDQNNTDLLQSALFTLTVKSDGLENVKVDSRIAPHNEGNPAEEDYWDYNSGNWDTESPWKETGIKQSLGEITTRKLVTKDSVINIDSLFKIYTTGATDSGVASTTYTVKLDATFVGGLRGKQSSVELMKMMRFNEDASVEGLAIENYYDGYYMDGDNKVDLGTDIRKITVIAPFNRDGATLTFTVMDNSGLYSLKLNVELVSNIATTNNFRSYMQEEGSAWHDYYKQSPDNPNAISVLAGKIYDLDTYLSFAEGSGFSWSTAKLTDETFSETSGIIQYVSNTGKIKVNDVYQDTNVTFTVHYMSSSTYAYSITVALYLIPNFKLVTKADTFVDLEKIVNGDASDDYEMKDFFEIQRIDNTDESSLPVLGTFNYINTSANKYLRVEGGFFKLEQSSTVFEYNFGQNYSQDFAIQYSQQAGGTEVLVDMAIVANGGDIIVAERGQTKLSFVMGYYNSNVQEMLKQIIPDAKVVTYNGSLYLLLLAGTTYQMNGFSIYKNEQTGEVGVRPMGYISSTNLQAISTLGSVEGFLSDQEYAIIQRTLSGEFVLRMRLNAIVTSVGEIFANYENNPEDLAVLIGDYTALQDNNVEQKLVAGAKYDVVHFRKNVSYKLTQDENIDWTKTYYNSSFEAVTFYYLNGDEYTETAVAVEGVDTYYIKNGDAHDEVTAGVLASLYEHDEAYGFFIDPAKYAENEYLTINLSIVESARGYIAGLAELDGNKLIIHELAHNRTDVYVVLCLTLSDSYSGTEYKWYYRILVDGSFEVGEVFYPYAKESEYLEATSEYYNVVDQANGIVDPSGDRVYKYYEINLEEEFDNKTMVSGHKRFKFDVAGAEARTEVLSVVLVGDTSSKALLPTSYTADGKDYLVYGQYLLINIDDNVLKIYLKDSSSKYIVKLRRNYYKEDSLMKGAELDYIFKINLSPNYDFEAKKVQRYEQVKIYYNNNGEYTETTSAVEGVEQYYTYLQGSSQIQLINTTIMKGFYVQDGDSYTLTTDTSIDWSYTYYEKYSASLDLSGNIFTMTAVAGSEEVVIDTKIGYRLSGSQTDWNVPYAVYVVGEEGFITPDSFSYDRETKQIRFTPSANVARNGSFEIGFYEVEYDGAGEKCAVDTSLVVFKIVVNVESFYKYQILKTEVESGAKNKFSDIFYIYDSNAGYGSTEDDTIDWSKTYFEKVGENYNAIKFYYKDGESTYKETSTAVTGKIIYVKFNGDSGYREVTAEIMHTLYEYQPDLSMKSEVAIDNGTDVYAYVKTTDNDIVWGKEYYLFGNNEYTKIDEIYYYAAIPDPTSIDIDVVKVFFIKDGESYIEMTPENISTYLYVEVEGHIVSCGDERIDLNKTYYIDNAGTQALFYYRCLNGSAEKVDGLTYLYKDGSTYYEFAGAGIRRLYERLTIGDIAKVDRTNHIIDHAYVSNNTTLKLTATYEGFNFSFDLTLLAKNPYTTTRFTDEIIRYGKVEYDLTIEHLRDHAANKNSMFDDEGTYKFVTEKDDEISLSNSVKIVPKDYAEAHIETVRYKIAYLFGEKYISDFIVEYNYTIYPNIEILVNYPDPDDKQTVSTEYYQSGVTGEISFDQQALFGKAARILTDDIALEFDELTAAYIPAHLYEKSGDNYNRTSDTEINKEKTYYVYNGAEYKVADIRYYNGKYYLAEKAQDFEKDWKVEISNIADVSVVVGATSYTELSGDEIGKDTRFELVLNQGKASGTITFKVTINSIVVYYTFNVINHEVFTTETNETNYALVDETNQAEYIYAEDLAGYESQQLFENNRILGYAFNSNATIGQTYYVRMTLKGSTAYRIVAIRASSFGRLNTDMGSSAENYEFTRAYTDLSYAQAGTNEGVADGIFSTVPFVTSRIVFKYGDGTNTTEIKNSSAWVGKGDTQFTSLQESDYKNTENTLVYTIKLKVGDKTIGVSSKNYALYLTSEFVVNGSADSRDSYVIGEVNAGSSVSLFNDLAAYGIVNSRLGVAYSDSVMMQSNGNIALDILGFDDTPIPITVSDDSLQKDKELNWFYRQYGLTPRANGFVINGKKTSDLTYNYVTLSANKGGTEDGKIRDYFIRAQGAKNEGNYIMLRITYSVAFAGGTIEESYNLLLKVNPATTIYFNGTSRVAGEETIDGDKWATNKSDPIIVSNNIGSIKNELSLYNSVDKMDVSAANNAVVAYLYGNTGSGGNNLQGTTVGFDIANSYSALGVKHDGVYYNEYNSNFNGSVTTSVSDNKFVMPSLQIGTQNYFLNFTNNFGYKIRLYVRLVGNVIPTLDMTDTINEGDKIFFGSNYTQLDVDNSGLKVKYNDADYQMFTNAVDSDNAPVEMKDKMSNLLQEGKLKVGEGKITVGDVLFVLSNVPGLYINPTNSENGWIGYSNDVYISSSVSHATTSDSNQKVYKKSGESYTEWYDSDTVYQFKLGYKWEGTSEIKDITWTKDSVVYTLYPNYTAGSTVTTAGEVKDGVSATLGGFTANAFSSDMGIISKKGIEKSSFGISNLPNFKILSVTFELDGKPLYTSISSQQRATGRISTADATKIFSDNVKYVIKSTSDELTAANGNKYNEGNYIQVPRIDGFYYGTEQTLNNVTMIVKLTDGRNTGTVTKVLSLKHGATIGTALTKEVKDGDPIQITTGTTGVTAVYNDTLQVELDKGAKITFALQLGQNGVAGDAITLTNDKGYKTTKYIRITEHLNGLTENLKSDSKIYISVTENTGAVIKYNDAIKVGYKSTLSANFNIADADARADVYDSMTMHIENASEVSSAAGYVSRSLYFIYKFKYDDGAERIYQAKANSLTEVNIYPQFSTSSTANMDTQGRFIISANYYDVDKIDGGPDAHKVIPFNRWANSVDLQYRNETSTVFSDHAAYKFIFEVNQEVVGGAGAGYINEYGNIILYPSFTLGVDTITINVYLKPTLVDGNFDTTSGWLLGQYRIYLNEAIQGTHLPDYCIYQGYPVPPTAQGSYGENFTAKVNEEFEFKNLFEETTGSNYHYHVISDEYTPVGGSSATITKYRYDNRDTWKFTTAGTHKLTIVKTWKNGAGSWQETKTMTFFVYDESVGQEETILIKGPDIFVKHNGSTYTVLDMNDLYEVAQTTDGTVDMTKTYYKKDGANYKKQEIYTYDFRLYDSTPSGNDNAYFRIVDSNNIPHYIPVSSEWIKHNLYEGDNNTLSTDAALVANKTYRYKTSSGFYSVARFYKKVFVPVSTKLGTAYLHRLEYLEISSDTQSYADTYYTVDSQGEYQPFTSVEGKNWYIYNNEYVEDGALSKYILATGKVDPAIIYYSDANGQNKVHIYYQRYSGTQNLAVADYYTSDTGATKVDMTKLYEFTKTTDTYINWTKPYYFTIDGGETYNLEIFYDKDKNWTAHSYTDGTGYEPIQVTYNIGDRSVIDGNKLTGSPAFNTSGKYSSYVINKTNGEFIKYTFYVYTGSVTEKYRKTSNEDFSMSNLASDVTAFWRIETSAASMNGASVTLTRITKENTVTTDSTVYYLGLKTDGTYKIYGVEYTIVGNLSGKFGSIDKDDNVISTIKTMFGNPDNIADPTYTIYRVGKNGILQDVSEAIDNVAGMIRRRMIEQNPGATDDEINALVAAEMSRTNLYEDEFVIIYNNKTYRTRFSLYFYEEAKTINYVTVEDVAFTLPTLNDIVLETVEKAGRVNYYNIEMTSGTLQEVLTITLDDLSYRATTYTYYIKVTTTSSEEFYYLITFNFFGVSREAEIIHTISGSATYQLSTLDQTIKASLGITAEGTTLKYYSTDKDLEVVVEGDKTYYELQTITTDSISFEGDETMVVKTYYIEETTTKTYYKATIRFVKESLTQLTIIKTDIAGETNYRLNNLTNTLRSKAGTAGTITYYVKNGQTFSRVETITIEEDRVELYIQIRAQGEQEITYTWRKVLIVTTEGSDVIEDPDAEIKGDLDVVATVNDANTTFDLTDSTFVESVKAAFFTKTGISATNVAFYSNDRGVLDPVSQIELIGVTTEGITKGYYVKISYVQGEDNVANYYTCRITFKLVA